MPVAMVSRVRAPTRSSHRSGVSSSASVGRQSGPRQAASSASIPTVSSRRVMNCSPISYWRIFISMPMSLRNCAADAARLPAGLEGGRHALLAR